MSLIQQFDASLLLSIQEHVRSGFLTSIMIFFSTIGSSGLIWITAAAVMLVFKKTRYGGIVLLLCLSLSWVINDGILKPLIHRARPYETLQGLQVLIPLRHDFSFPSGHTTTAFASAFAITRALGKRWSWVYAVAALIAFSRIYLGMHNPTDVLGGMVFGTLCAVAISALADRYIKPRFIPGQQEI